ncbi:Mitochondrial thiamine pyrophosphate carrier, partial [Tetrabaena socialis]
GLWRGTVPGLLLTVPYTAVQFVALQQIRQAAADYGLTANPGTGPLVSLASGALAGAAATVASYPFDLLRTTLAAQGEPKQAGTQAGASAAVVLQLACRVYRNMWEAGRGIVSARGPAGLYGGMGVTLVEIMPYAALQFGLYDAFNAL